MTGNIFAVCMIAMLVGALAALLRWGTRPSSRGTVIGLLLALVCFVALGFLTPTQACRRGGTIIPVLPGSVLAGVVFAAIPVRKVAAPLMIALLVSGYALTLWGMELVHESPYVGNPNWPRQLERISSSSLQTARIGLLAVSPEYPDAVLPEGWVEESLHRATGEEPFTRSPGHRSGKVSHFWHTWFTGIYRLETYPNGVWCPGGTISNCVERLEIRARYERNRSG